MAPKASSKRALASAAGAAKKAKVDPAHSRVVEIIELSTLPEGTRKMLAAMVPGCLGPCVDERHHPQERAVTMIAEVVDEVVAAKQAALGMAEAGVLALVESKASLAGTLAECEVALTEANRVVCEQDAIAKTRTSEMLAAKHALSERQETQHRCEADLAQWRKDKEAYEAAIGEDLAGLKAGTCELAVAKAYVSKVMPLAESLGLEKSLVTVAPSALLKKPDERGPFDGMIVMQLEKTFADKVIALAKAIEDGIPVSEEHATATAAALTAANVAADAEASAKDEATKAVAAQNAASGALSEAKGAIDNYEPMLKKAIDDRDATSAQLEDFLRCNVAIFTELRDKVARKQEEAAPDVEAVAAPEAPALAEEKVAASDVEMAVPHETPVQLDSTGAEAAEIPPQSKATGMDSVVAVTPMVMTAAGA